MYRVDLIKNIARLAGIPDISTKDFIEVFFWKLTEVLIEDDLFLIKNLGYFKINNLSGKVPQDESAGYKVILFSENDRFSDDVLVFGVPETPFRKKEEIDSFLSLSVGKPVIPVTPAQFSEKSTIYLPEDLEKLYDYKSEEILAKGEFLRNNIPIKVRPKSSRNESPAAATVDPLIVEDNFKEEATESEWQFGDDWTKELNESSLLETTESERSIWDDVGGDAFEVTQSGFTSSDTGDSEPEKITFEDLVEEEFSSRQSPATVFSDTKELTIDLSEFDEESEASARADEKVGQNDDTHNFDLIFKKSMAKNVLMAVPVPQPENKNNSEAVYDENDEDGQSDSDSEGSEGDQAEGKAFDIAAKVHELPRNRRAVNLLTAPFKSGDRRKFQSDQPLPKTSKLVYVGFFILCVCIAGFIYYKDYGIPKFLKPYIPKEEIVYNTKYIATVIERDYDVPVTYPYPSLDKVATGETKTVLPEPVTEAKPEAPAPEKKFEEIPMGKSVSRSENKSTLPPEQKKLESSPVKKEQSSSYLVKDNIFKEGENYVIQLFSTKVKSEAMNAVDRLKSKGVTAYVMEAEIPGRGTWYRVRMGTFKSLGEAEDFARTVK